MKSLRRSFQNKEHHPGLISTPVTSVSKPTTVVQPPSKVIRALGDNKPTAPNQLHFRKGDFFYVINDTDPEWYEATNPISGARGLVPKSKFEEFQKANAAIRMSQQTNFPPKISKPVSHHPSPASPRQPVFYGVVQHDFMAERADELDAKAGDPVTIVAQSNYEWFVAKPISRLGRPGLIPVSFVALHDPATGQSMSEDAIKSLMERGEVPGVEDWKKAILDYKAASISLGVIEDDSKGPVPNSPYMPQSPPRQANAPPTPPNSLPLVHEEPRVATPPPPLSPGVLISAEVLSWHYEMEEYWFRINAVYQPDDPSGSPNLPPAKQLVLFRVYNDFYDFQVELLNLFPIEAGRESGNQGAVKRILPYMPGPAPKVDDKVTIMRKDELHAYLVQLCGLWQFGAEHILRHSLIRDFFAPKAGDVEEDVEPLYEAIEERQRAANRRVNGTNGKHHSRGQSSTNTDQINHPFAQLSVKEHEDDGLSDGSHYDDSEPPPVLNNRLMDAVNDRSSRGSNNHSTRSLHKQIHGRSDSSSSAQRQSGGRSPYDPAFRTQSPMPDRTQSGLSRNNSEGPNNFKTADASGSYPGREPLSAGSRSSNPTPNNPPISSSNPTTAFVKIKIFDRQTQDLIAIRVNPRVTHSQLMEKVCTRLGSDVRGLAFRNSFTNQFVGISNDRALKDWLDSAEKLVLYAD